VILQVRGEVSQFLEEWPGKPRAKPGHGVSSLARGLLTAEGFEGEPPKPIGFNAWVGQQVSGDPREPPDADGIEAGLPERGSSAPTARWLMIPADRLVAVPRTKGPTIAEGAQPAEKAAGLSARDPASRSRKRARADRVDRDPEMGGLKLQTRRRGGAELWRSKDGHRHRLAGRGHAALVPATSARSSSSHRLRKVSSKASATS
jgi:hypothetical protein